MTEVHFGYPNQETLTLHLPERSADGELMYIEARIGSDRINAASKVTAHYAKCFDDLVAYVEDLAQNWQGWDGQKEYQSLQRELRISATHDGVGHVRLEVTLKGQGDIDPWRTTVIVVTDPGTQMDEAAQDARNLLARWA
jgi:hypothetical protein